VAANRSAIGYDSPVFVCPSDKAVDLPTNGGVASSTSLFNDQDYGGVFVVRSSHTSYGFNAFGPGFNKPYLGLGLGAAGGAPISDSQVKTPADMIAVGDSSWT
jgi:hypothetical protein